ncbi:hypothetical protein SKAU_G00074550 [Synaphobranchus kaupii]|uniref:Uncharacterized protein n=1 Tax=Synaphobranchus kaupii TaxID=118154 RepID=A0A9Q1JC17_SYNKA|nr:hypothetical protein SKAU_G00074550 [Synaphobranchus kaupii]
MSETRAVLQLRQLSASASASERRGPGARLCASERVFLECSWRRRPDPKLFPLGSFDPLVSQNAGVSSLS